VNRNKFVDAWNRWKEWNPFALWQGWSRPHKALIYAVIILLVVLLILSNTVWRSERVVERVVITPGSTVTVTDPELAETNVALGLENVALKANNTALDAKNTTLNNDLNKANADLEKANNDLNKANADLEKARGTTVDPELIPKIWTSFTGDEAMKLALSTFGNIRIKIWFSEGSVPLLSEVTALLSQKPPNLTLSAWIGGETEQTRNWPVGMATPDAGDWPTEIFLAKDDNGTVKYYYIAPITGNVMLVTRTWATSNNIYWLFVITSFPRG